MADREIRAEVLSNSNVNVHPEQPLEAWEQCHFNLDFQNWIKIG